jgi:hypothetical protein
MDILYIGRVSFPDPSPICLKFLFCVVLEFFNLKDLMRLMQKTYLLPMQIGMQLAKKNLRSVGFTGDTVLFPTIGNAVNVRSPDIGKPDIYCRKD